MPSSLLLFNSTACTAIPQPPYTCHSGKYTTGVMYEQNYADNLKEIIVLHLEGILNISTLIYTLTPNTVLFVPGA